MNPALPLQHFDRISETPDAISRLRQFILDLDQVDNPAVTA